MKININAPVESVEYKIESEYGLLECVFYTEKISEHLFKVFSVFATDLEDYYSANPSFEKYYEAATENFAEQFPKRLEELLTETVEEVTLKTLTEFGGISREEAKTIIDKAVRETITKKKARMNAPSSGRPKQSNRDILRSAVMVQVEKAPRLMNPTLNWVADKLNLKSGEALRKELKRNNLDWKELKKRT